MFAYVARGGAFRLFYVYNDSTGSFSCNRRRFLATYRTWAPLRRDFLTRKAFWRIRHFLWRRQRPRIPAIDADCWSLIFLQMHRHESVPFRRLSRFHRNLLRARMTGPVCSFCGLEAFIPVAFGLRSTYGALLCTGYNEGSCALIVKEITMAGGQNSRFCESERRFNCLRCTRDHIQQCLQSTTPVQCPLRCCELDLDSAIRFMGGNVRHMTKLYGEVPRSGRDPAHSQLYEFCDKMGVCTRRCHFCGYVCSSLRDAVLHIRTVCRRT